jgi:hypothetical protein
MAAPIQDVVAADGSRGQRSRNNKRPQPNRPYEPPSTSKARISHACDRCRVMRTKCSGGDRCSKCVKDQTACVYSDRRRERNKKYPALLAYMRVPLLITYRALAESQNRIGALQAENSEIRRIISDITQRPDFRPEEHAELLDILAQVYPA